VLCTQSWWRRWSFWHFKCSHTIILKVWPGCSDHIFSIWYVSYSSHLGILTARFPLCSLLTMAALPHLQNVVDGFYSVQWALLLSYFISMSFSVLVMSNAGSYPANYPALPWDNCLTTTVWWRVLHVVFDYPQLISSRPTE
jgi:hypothetical protein